MIATGLLSPQGCREQGLWNDKRIRASSTLLWRPKLGFQCSFSGFWCYTKQENALNDPPHSTLLIEGIIDQAESIQRMQLRPGRPGNSVVASNACKPLMHRGTVIAYSSLLI